MASKIVKTQNTIRQNDLYSYWVLQIPDQIFRPYPFNVFLSSFDWWYRPGMILFGTA